MLAELLSSRVKAEVFRLLFGIDAASLHLREIERQSGLAVGTVRQELQRLTTLGVVERRADGNRTLYTANRHHPLFPEIRNLVLKTSGLVEVLREALSGDAGINFAFVFGSIANFEEKPHSDIDLMVIGSIGLRNLAPKLSGLGERLSRDINPHAFTVEEFGRRKNSLDHFVSNILGSPRLFVVGTEYEFETVGQ